jgi:DNA polymerase III delta prime subunit
MSLVNHHAYLVISAWEKEALIEELLSALGVEVANNPDLVVHEGSFGIDEARSITMRVSSRPFGERRALILDARNMTVQAQNALLKTLEEPGVGNHFFLVAPYEDILLPTLRSRMQVYRREKPDDTTSPKKFLALTSPKRLDFAKKFKDEERDLGSFLDALLAYLRELGRDKDVKKVFELRPYADDTSSDSRLILEHLSLVLE